MGNNLNKQLDAFLSEDEKVQAFDDKVKSSKKEILNSKTGLIERVDKIFVTEDGRQLLREQY